VAAITQDRRSLRDFDEDRERFGKLRRAATRLFPRRRSLEAAPLPKSNA
jgi:hypothetical protein